MVFSHIARIVASIMLVLGVVMVALALYITTGDLGPAPEVVQRYWPGGQRVKLSTAVFSFWG